MTTVLIAGAGLAGTRCAEALRAESFDGRIVLLGEEPVEPYERPALSKELLAGKRRADDLALRPAGFWAEQGIELRLGKRVSAFDPVGRTATTADGAVLSWDALVLAIGARARRLPGSRPLAGVHHLRTLADALALGEELESGRRLAVVGAGFIGGEVASTARALGVNVTLVGGGAAPLERVLGREVGGLLAERYRAHGVTLELGTPVAGLVPGRDGRVRSVRLADGRELRCDVALVAVGAVTGEIATDACGRTAVPGVYACGDAASAWRPRLARRLRAEHWTSAAGQAAAVAAAILGRSEPYDDVPYFWSDQFGLRLQHVGHAERWARIELEGDGKSFGVRYLDEDGRLLAALTANRPREIGPLRRELALAA